MGKPRRCKACGEEGHYAYSCWKARRQPIKAFKRPRKRSDKQIEYDTWLKEVARPAVVARDGERWGCPVCVPIPKIWT